MEPQYYYIKHFGIFLQKYRGCINILFQSRELVLLETSVLGITTPHVSPTFLFLLSFQISKAGSLLSSHARSYRQQQVCQILSPLSPPWRKILLFSYSRFSFGVLPNDIPSNSPQRIYLLSDFKALVDRDRVLPHHPGSSVLLLLWNLLLSYKTCPNLLA